MRNIHDRCLCGGQLLPREPLQSHLRDRSWDHFDMLHRPLDAAARVHHRREPESTQTVLSHLACDLCSLIYEAAQAGVMLEKLREEAYQDLGPLPSTCDKCPRCDSVEFAKEYVSGPYGVMPERVERRPLEELEKHRVAMYCRTCNAIVALLELDPEVVTAHAELSARIASMVEARKDSGLLANGGIVKP